MTKSEIRDKQIRLLSIIFEVANSSFTLASANVPCLVYLFLQDNRLLILQLLIKKKPKTPTCCEQRQTNKQKYICADLLSWHVFIRMVPCEKYISLLISWNLYTDCVETPTRSLAGVRLMNFSIREWSEVKKIYLSFLVLSITLP